MEAYKEKPMLMPEVHTVKFRCVTRWEQHYFNGQIPSGQGPELGRGGYLAAGGHGLLR